MSDFCRIPMHVTAFSEGERKAAPQRGSIGIHAPRGVVSGLRVERSKDGRSLVAYMTPPERAALARELLESLPMGLFTQIQLPGSVLVQVTEALHRIEV